MVVVLPVEHVLVGVEVPFDADLGTRLQALEEIQQAFAAARVEAPTERPPSIGSQLPRNGSNPGRDDRNPRHSGIDRPLNVNRFCWASNLRRLAVAAMLSDPCMQSNQPLQATSTEKNNR